MSIHFYSEKEEYKKEESINNYKHIFIEYINKSPTLFEALKQLFISEGAKDEELNELIEDIITKCKEIIDTNFDEIKKKYPNISYDEALIISSYTAESKNKKYNPYTILNSNLVLDNRQKGINNISKYFFILLNSLRKLPRFYPDKNSPFLYRCIGRQVSINYNQYKPKLIPYISGQIKTFWAFTSTSLNILTNFLNEDNNKNIKSGTIFTLTGDVWGYDITLFNHYKENEILLEPERKFQIEQVIPPINDLINIRCIMQDSPLVLNDFGYKDYITIRYKIYRHEKIIRIFGDKFVENNTGFFPWSNKGIIRYKNNKLNLQTHLDVSDYNITDIIEIKLEGISYITNISYMFFDCDRLLSIPDIFMWDTSNINNMEYLFYGCTNLSSIPKIDCWKTEKVISMKHIFSKTNLKSLPKIFKLDIKNLKYVEGMFEGLEPNISSLKIFNKTIDFPLIFYPHSLNKKFKKLFLEYYKRNGIPLIELKLKDLDLDSNLCKDHFNHIFNIGIIGTLACGKTSIIHYLEKGKKLEKPYINIVPAHHGKIILLNNKKCNINLFDFSGQYKIIKAYKNYLSKLHAIILIFSLTKEEEYDDYDKKIDYITNLKRYLDWYYECNKNYIRNIYLVGNKVDDKENRKISKEDAKKFALNNNFVYFETSAFTGENINELFENLILNLMEIYPDLLL